MKEIKSMFNEMLLKNTRDVLNAGKDFLTKKEINTIVAYTLKSYDKLNGIKAKEINEYFELADELPNKQEVYNLVGFLVKKYRNRKDDEHLDVNDKIKIYMNSIEIAEELCSGMTATNKYNRLESLKKVHTDRFNNCRYKAEVTDDMIKIFALLKEINANYIHTLDDGYAFYPIITDFLVDTLTLEYSYEFNELMVKSLARDFHSLSMKKAILRNLNIIFFSQVEFTKKVQKKSANLYILHEYARKFNCDVTLMRKLQMELLYWDIKEHSRALQSKRFDIQRIKPRNFILSQCKFIGLVS